MTRPTPPAGGGRARDGGRTDVVGSELPLPVALIGPMGAGKSSIGGKLARRLRVAFVDSDRALVREHGSIAGLFEQHGEPHFRRLEREVVAESLRSPGVVSLGGGAVLDPATRDLLRGVRVVLLTVTPEAVEARLDGTTRPLLQTGGLAAWRRIAAERDPVYRDLAHLVLDTSSRPVSTVVDDVVAWLAEGAPGAPPVA